MTAEKIPPGRRAWPQESRYDAAQHPGPLLSRKSRPENIEGLDAVLVGIQNLFGIAAHPGLGQNLFLRRKVRICHGINAGGNGETGVQLLCGFRFQGGSDNVLQKIRFQRNVRQGEAGAAFIIAQTFRPSGGMLF